MNMLTTATAPWWFVAALTGVLALVSGALGAFISMWSARLSDRRRAIAEQVSWERGQTTEQQRELRNAASALLVAARRYVGVYRSNFVRITESGGHHHWEARDPRKLNDLSLVYEPYWTVVFLGSAAQQQAAQGLMSSIRRFEVRSVDSVGEGWLTSDAYTRASDDYLAARSRLVNSMSPSV